MEFQDKVLRCVDCSSEFIWTAGEQLFFADKQFKNEPKRCKTCKAKRANSPGPGRNPDLVLGMWKGHDGALPAHAGTAGVLQGMLPATEVFRRRRRLIPRAGGPGSRFRRPLPKKPGNVSERTTRKLAPVSSPSSLPNTKRRGPDPRSGPLSVCYIAREEKGKNRVCRSRSGPRGTSPFSTSEAR
jgi:hypothetical protein